MQPEIYVTDYSANPEPPYRYEAYFVPMDTYASGGIVGYSDESVERAVTQLRLLLIDLGIDAKDAVVLTPYGEELEMED